MKEEVKRELEEMGSPLARQKVGLPYGEPQGYFEAMPGRVAAMLGGETAATGLPAVPGPYAVPGGYFEALPEQVLARTRRGAEKGGRVTFRQLRVAAAAVVLLAVGMGTFMRGSEPRMQVPEERALANVADKDIKEYLGYAGAPMADVAAGSYLENVEVGPDDIENYLDETGWEAEMSF